MLSFLLMQSANKAYYRFVMLFFNCLLSFGSYFCFDIPSVLQDQFQGNLTCPNATVTNGTVDCMLGLGMSPQQYNSLFAISSWANAVLLMLSGLLIDKYGNPLGVYVFSALCILGSILFALGSHFKGTPYLLPIMLLGRLLSGSGTGSLNVVQDCITSTWFKHKELGFAFGMTIGMSRLGSVLNFFITKRFEEKYGMQWTLWGGTLLCVLGFIIGIVVSAMDKTRMRQLDHSGTVQEESRKMRIQDLKLLSLRYWLLTLSIMFFYNIIFPFLANSSEFFQDKYGGYNQMEGPYITGSFYDCSLVLTPLAGILTDYVGLRGIFLLASSILTVPIFGLLAFTYVPPLVSTILLACTYSLFAMCTWPAISLVVPQSILGLAMSLTVSIHMAGNGVCNLVIGWILGTTSSQTKIPLWRWQRMMIFLLANIICCSIITVLLSVVDYRQGSTLNKPTKRTDKGERDSDTESLNKVENEKNGAIKNGVIKNGAIYSYSSSS